MLLIPQIPIFLCIWRRNVMSSRLLLPFYDLILPFACQARFSNNTFVTIHFLLYVQPISLSSALSCPQIKIRKIISGNINNHTIKAYREVKVYFQVIVGWRPCKWPISFALCPTFSRTKTCLYTHLTEGCVGPSQGISRPTVPNRGCTLIYTSLSKTFRLKV